MPAPTPPEIDYPNWATADVDDPVTGFPNVQEPPDTKILNGMNRLEFMPRQWINWLFRSTGSWIQYLRELADFTTTALATEVTARGNAVSTEATARSNADSAEATARTNADNTLQANINAVGGTWVTWTPSPLLSVETGSGSISIAGGGYRYKIIGKTFFIHWDLVFTVTGTVSVLKAVMPPAFGNGSAGYFTGSAAILGAGISVNSVMPLIRPDLVIEGQTTLYLSREAGANFPAGTEFFLAGDASGEVP